MDISTLLLIILIPVAIYLIINRQKTAKKDPVVKKHELIENYKKQMQDVLDTTSHDPSLQSQEKIKLLKKINHELSMNLFFDENEAKELLNVLAKMN